MTQLQLIPIFCVLGLLTAEASAQDASSSSGRPAGFSVGIGAGWDIPASIDEFDTTSVRFRLANGLTIEPLVTAAVVEDDSTLGDSTLEQTTTGVALLVVARWPLVSRGPVDFLVTGGAALGQLKVNPEGDENTVKTTSVAAVYGLSVEYWWGPRWTFSFTASNPIYLRNKVTTDNVDPDQEREQLDTLFGAVFVPDVVAMIHLFY